ncbi:MAG: hypothetical protein NC343_06300 [Muribaculum sp.]|nr:hypothetical protein [Muribaculaceae bacterium]MCM1081344.1 hypothetical protein [Muribaculum sp.]
MKKLLFLTFILVSSFTFTSCGGDNDKDDNNDEPATNKSLLVGKWQSEEEEYGYDFYANGTGYGWEGYRGRLDDMWEIKWTEKNKTLTIRDVEDYGDKYDEDVEKYKIMSVSSSILILKELDEGSSSEGYIYKFKKVSNFIWE